MCQKSLPTIIDFVKDMQSIDKRSLRVYLLHKSASTWKQEKKTAGSSF
jgi:hypothetical protein